MYKLSILLIIFCIVSCSLIFAKPTDDFDELVLKGKNLIEDGVRKWDDKVLLEGRSLFERLAQNDKMKWLTQYYIGYADYRLAIFYESQNKRELLIKYLDDGIKNLNASIAENDKFADSQALLSSLLGQKIGTDPSLSMTLGMQSGIAIGKAMELDKNNPRVMLISAISAYYTPEQYGGSKTRAMQEMQRTVELFKIEKLEDPRLPDWGHSEAWTWLGQFNLNAEIFEAAKQNLENALKIDPDNSFAKLVKGELEKKMAEK